MIPEGDRPGLTWGNDVLMQVEGAGSFVRILVPIKLTGGHTTTYGAWLSVHPEDLRRAWEVWTTPAYKELRLQVCWPTSFPDGCPRLTASLWRQRCSTLTTPPMP